MNPFMPAKDIDTIARASGIPRAKVETIVRLAEQRMREQRRATRLGNGHPPVSAAVSTQETTE